MKVGILTYHSSYNFGANLQALAVQSAVLRCGSDAVIINYQDAEKMDLYKRITSAAQGQQHENFMRRYLRLSPLLSKESEVEQFCLDTLDAVFVGSDAVFRLPAKYHPVRALKRILGRQAPSVAALTQASDLPPYWLDWHNGIGGRIYKATIAASATGTPFYLLDCRLYRKLYQVINKFDFLSVRDNWTRTMIKFLSGGRKEPELCPDPVFSLNDNFTMPESERAPSDVSKTVLVTGSFPPAWIEQLVDALHDRGLKVANLPNPDQTFQFREADSSIVLPLSPLTWYSYLANAAGYVGIRFHALVSCLANATPVVATDPVARLRFNHKAKSRIYDLCVKAQIQERYSYANKVARTTVARVIERLFDQSSLDRGTAYAQRASEQFNSTIRRVIESAALKS